ncbi:MAG TPA: TPM domain-containing protein [Candidatus Baltobacteraceae bacterium]|jgi:uncharacterized membrane protein
MRALDGDRITQAIESQERATTGRIAVRIVPHVPEDPVADARAALHAAELHEGDDRNAIVFLVAPKARRFSVYGDRGIHERVGETFWKDVVAEMTPYFRNGEPTEGLIHGIARAGAVLREHFPK